MSMKKTIIKRFTNSISVLPSVCRNCSGHLSYRGCFKYGLSLNKKAKKTYSSVLHSHTVLMKLCPCGRLRQLNSVLYPNNHILNTSKIIFNGLVLTYV